MWWLCVNVLPLCISAIIVLRCFWVWCGECFLSNDLCLALRPLAFIILLFMGFNNRQYNNPVMCYNFLLLGVSECSPDWTILLLHPGSWTDASPTASPTVSPTHFPISVHDYSLPVTVKIRRFGIPRYYRLSLPVSKYQNSGYSLLLLFSLTPPEPAVQDLWAVGTLVPFFLFSLPPSPFFLISLLKHVHVYTISWPAHLFWCLLWRGRFGSCVPLVHWWIPVTEISVLDLNVDWPIGYKILLSSLV